MSKLVIQKESQPIRCEICHKTDEYDFLLNKCNRCEDIIPPEDTNFILEYSVSFKDYFIAVSYHTLKMPVLYLVFGVYALISFFICFVDTHIFQSLFQKIFTFLLLSAIFIIFNLVIIFIVNLLSIISKRNKTLLTNYKLITTDKSFIEENEYIRTEIKWKTIQAVERTKNYIFIYIAQHRVIVIPIKYCWNISLVNNFYKYVKRKFDETRASKI
jgi:hypothetical protein